MLKAIRMINCQSWLDETIELATDRINLFIADNSEGKSVFFKMLKVTVCKDYYNRKIQETFIRDGKNFACIMYLFDDGSVASVKIFHNKTVYYYAEDGKTFVQSDSPFPEVIFKLGVLVDQTTSFIANIIDMDSPLLLVDSNNKQNYNLVKLLTNHEGLNELEEKINLLIKQFGDNLSDLGFKLTDYNSLLNKYTYYDIDSMEKSVNQAEKVYDLFCKLVDLIDICEKTERNIQEDPGYDKMISIIDTLLKLKELYTICNTIKIRDDVPESYISLVDKIHRFHQNILNVQYVDFHDYDKDTKTFNLANKLMGFSKVLQRIQIKDHVDFDLCNTQLELINKLQHFSIMLQSLANLKMEEYNLEFSINDLQNKLDAYDDIIDGCPIYGKVLFKNGKCISDCD